MLYLWFEIVKCYILQTHKWLSQGWAVSAQDKSIPKGFVKLHYKCMRCNRKISILDHLAHFEDSDELLANCLEELLRLSGGGRADDKTYELCDELKEYFGWDDLLEEEIL